MPAINVVVSDATSSAAGVQPASDTSNAEAKADPQKSEPAANAADTSALTKTEVSASESVKADDEPSEAKAEASSETKIEAPTAAVANTEPTRIETPKVEAAERPAEPVKAVADAPAVPAVAPDVKKDTARPPGAAAKAEPPRRPGQIAVFVSRKDSKLYVRENFKPQFEVPITIAPSDRPLGTHVFTAEADKKDTARNAARTDEDDRAARRRKVAGGALAEAKPLPMPNGPAEALDRITVAPEAMARIAEVLTTGGSIVVSDHGINQGGETGEGTDFIVPLRWTP
jgi:hypothetical protein